MKQEIESLMQDEFMMQRNGESGRLLSRILADLRQIHGTV